MPAVDPESVHAALARLLGDPELRERLRRAPMQTAQRYAWERIDALEAFLGDFARPRAIKLDTGAVPQVQQSGR